MSSFFSSASGIDSAQTGIDVIANNIANVNTVGYRGNQTQFVDLLYNASQVADKQLPVSIADGSGSKVAATVTQFTQGSLQNTGVSSNLAIQGDGFFALGDTATATPSSFTRAGNFVTDASGFLRTSSGLYVNGVGNFGTVASSKDYPAPTGALNSLTAVQIPQTFADGQAVSSYSIGAGGAIVATGANGGSVVVGYVPLATFRDNTGLSQSVGSNFTATPASGAATFYASGQGTAGTTQGGSVENSNVDLATQFSNMIITQQAFNASAKGLTVSNEILQTAIGLKR